jgi:ABC-type uncharacterized transport system auxiliary subunit
MLPNLGKQIALMAMSLFLGSCASQSQEMMRPFFFDFPPPTRASAAPIPQTLMVYQFLLDASVNPEFLIVSGVEPPPADRAVQRWQENPAAMITGLTLRDLASSGLFFQTIDQFSTVPYRYALEGTVRTMEGRIRDGKAVAILRVDVNLIDYEVPWAADKTLLTKAYHVEILGRDSSVEAMEAALSRAAAEYSRRLRRDLRSVMRKR